MKTEFLVALTTNLFLLKYEGTSKLKSGITRYKFVCPKIKWIKDNTTGKYHRQCQCDNPCTASPCGRMVYIYPYKIFVLIQKVYVEPMNGMIHIKSEPQWKEISITSKITSVLQDVEPKTRKLFMLI